MFMLGNDYHPHPYVECVLVLVPPPKPCCQPFYRCNMFYSLLLRHLKILSFSLRNLLTSIIV